MIIALTSPLNICIGCYFCDRCSNSSRVWRCDDFVPINTEYEDILVEEVIESNRCEFFSFWESYLNGTNIDDVCDLSAVE